MRSEANMDVDNNSPYEVHMHNSDALELLTSAAILLILDMPANSSFGLDTEMFVVGPKFRGVKMILPGPHFVYYSARSKHGGDSSPVTGFFIHASPSQECKFINNCTETTVRRQTDVAEPLVSLANNTPIFLQVIVRRWDPHDERLVKLADSSEEESFALAARNMEFDRQLAPYNLDRHKIWKSLTNFISPTVIEKIEPLGADISIMAEASLVQDVPKTSAEKRLYEQTNKNKKTHGSEDLSKTEEVSLLLKSDRAEGQGEKESSGRCFYSHLPHIIKKAGVSPSELTAMNIDRTRALETLLQTNHGGQEELLLGELQFCFIAFLMGQSLEAFGQWKGIVSLLLRCEDGPLRTRTTFFIKFLGVIYWQLKQSMQPEVKGSNDSTFLLEESWLAEDNFFKLLLKDFFNMLRDATPVNGELLRQVKHLRKLFETTLGWIFDVDSIIGEEGDEYAPVVVYDEDCRMGEATGT